MTKRACIVRQGAYPADLLVRREAETLRDGGYEVDVICHLVPGQPAQESIDGVGVHRLPIRLRRRGTLAYMAGYVLFFVSVAIRLTVLHLRHPYTVIQVNTMPDFLVFATLIPRLLGARVGLVMYEPMPELWQTLYHNRPWLIRLLEMIQTGAIRYAHVTFAVTQQQKDSFVARGAPADKIKVLLNVPDPRIWQQFVPATRPENEHFVLICHGRIDERYGHDTMLDAIMLVKDQIPNLRLRILGNGKYVDGFLERVKTLGIESMVTYAGWVPLAQMVEELYNADVGIVAQKSSPYSNLVHTGKMYDFMAFGKPVLASRLRAVEAYFPDALCYFESGDPESLARGIRELYDHPERRQELVARSQALYNQYKWENQKHVLLSAYRALALPRGARNKKAAGSSGVQPGTGSGQ